MSYTLGYSSIGGSSGTAGFQTIFGTAITVSSASVLNNLNVYLTSPGGNTYIAIYDASGPGGNPGNLIAQSNSMTVVSGWNTYTFGSPPSVPAGNYWIVYILSVDFTNQAYFLTSGGSGAWYSNPQKTVTYAAFTPTFPSLGGSTWTTVTGDNWSLYGTFTLSSGSANIAPAGIASTNAFGTATVARGAVNIAPNGIASTNAFGTATLSATASISPTGIASTNAFGTATVSASYSLAPSGIASTNAFGTASVLAVSNIAPTGIASTNVFGAALVVGVVPGNISPAGIASTTAFGTATLSPGAVNIAPAGIAKTNAFGTATVLASVNIAPAGIASTNAFGTAILTTGAANIAPAGIASTTAFGTATILQPSLQGISAIGIGSTTLFGTPVINAFAREQPVPPYAGDPQESEIDVPAWIRYREEQWEEGPWVMPPYAQIFPQPVPPCPCERGSDAFHHEWLKTHPRPKGHHGVWRPKSVLPQPVRTQPINVYANRPTLYRPEPTAED